MKFLVAILLGLCTLVSGHMSLSSPHAIREKSNPNAKNVDYDYTSPLSKLGTNFPCKGYHTLLSTPEGAAVATWPAGSQQSFVIQGGAAHNGGSCQAALSQDGGKTFRVMKSFIGGCPVAGKEYPFTVPKEAKEGPALFAWTWFNHLGAREMYMNCASITISGPGGQGMGPEYPPIFTANIGNGCRTIENFDVAFPDPGRFVENTSAKSKSPEGACGPAANGSVPSAAESPGTTLRTSKVPGTATQAPNPAPTAPTVTASSKLQTSKPSQTATRKASCSCVCRGYSFEISPDDL